MYERGRFHDGGGYEVGNGGGMSEEEKKKIEQPNDSEKHETTDSYDTKSIFSAVVGMFFSAPREGKGEAGNVFRCEADRTSCPSSQSTALCRTARPRFEASVWE